MRFKVLFLSKALLSFFMAAFQYGEAIVSENFGGLVSAWIAARKVLYLEESFSLYHKEL